MDRRKNLVHKYFSEYFDSKKSEIKVNVFLDFTKNFQYKLIEFIIADYMLCEILYFCIQQIHTIL